jgi:hypothetical protein
MKLVARTVLHSQKFTGFQAVFDELCKPGISTKEFVDRIDIFTRIFAAEFKLTFNQLRQLISELEIERNRVINLQVTEEWYEVPLRFRWRGGKPF